MLVPILRNLTQDDVTSLLLPSALKYTHSTCENIDHCRTIWNIIWSCLATIFVCIWAGVHPNMPVPRKPSQSDERTWLDRLGKWWDYWWPSAKNRMFIAGWALLAPELILVWAIRQRFTARAIAMECQQAEERWRVGASIAGSEPGRMTPNQMSKKRSTLMLNLSV